MIEREQPFLTLRYEGITATARGEFITVRTYAIWDPSPAEYEAGVRDNPVVINCGMVVMFHHVFAALALRPPEGQLVRTEVVMTEGTVEDYVEGVLAA